MMDELDHHKGDIVDQAAKQEEDFRNLALRGIAGKAQRETHPDFDGEHCLECGNEIPSNRLALGRIKCVECQTALEKLNKMRGIQ